MAKKKAKNMKKKNSKLSPDQYHLTNLILYTERSIKNDGSDLDQFFINQAKRLKQQLKETK